jgi:hypothetical protein
MSREYDGRRGAEWRSEDSSASAREPHTVAARARVVLDDWNVGLLAAAVRETYVRPVGREITLADAAQA